MSTKRCSTSLATKTIDPGSHRPPLAGHVDCATTRDDVVDLILGVRRLRVGRASREDIEAEAHRAFVDELKVRLAALRLLLADLAVLERVHRFAPEEPGPVALIATGLALS